MWFVGFAGLAGSVFVATTKTNQLRWSCSRGKQQLSNSICNLNTNARKDAAAAADAAGLSKQFRMMCNRESKS